MPLTKRQKRRLLEVSKMIESVIIVHKELSEIQTEYISEIEEVIDMIRQEKSAPNKGGQSSTDLSLYEESAQSNSNKTESSTNEHQSETNFEPPEIDAGPEAPEWAKRLWKGIAKKCHPDRLSFQELTAIEIARRQTWFLEARSLYELQQWSRLLHIGIQVDEYVDELQANSQLKMINDEYNIMSRKVSEIQDSLAWQWGTNWDNLELRVKILTACLTKQGIKLPPKIEMIKILVNLETE